MKWFVDLTEKQIEQTKYIYLYEDEYDSDVWEQYCKILGVDPNAGVLKLIVCGIKEE